MHEKPCVIHRLGRARVITIILLLSLLSLGVEELFINSTVSCQQMVSGMMKSVVGEPIDTVRVNVEEQPSGSVPVKLIVKLPFSV